VGVLRLGAMEKLDLGERQEFQEWARPEFLGLRQERVLLDLER